jgi:hypothetical protein
VDQAKDFLVKCREMLESDSNVFWVAFQSNVLSDVSQNVDDRFKGSFEATKKELVTKGWVLPALDSNMRNTMNINKISIQGCRSDIKMQTSIMKLGSGSSVVGEVPSLFKVQLEDWRQKKERVMKYCIEEMAKKSNKNILILYDGLSDFKDIETTVNKIIIDKTVVGYPSICRNKVKSVDNVICFTEQANHVLVTEGRYFNGAEVCNIIFLSSLTGSGMRNCFMRAVENVMCVQLTMIGSSDAKITGMKEDNRFLYK